MGADAVMCHPTAIVGSIGVIMQSMDLSRAIAAFGVEMDPIKSGRMKDLNTPWRSMTKAERLVLEKLVDDMYQRFVDVVDAGRKKLDREKVLELADGRVFSGVEAAKRCREAMSKPLFQYNLEAELPNPMETNSAEAAGLFPGV